jgi:DNA anti-recombination protein RmuC
MRFASLLVFSGLLLLLNGCSSAYYGAMEKVGVHKREILVDRVEGAREAQAEAKEQFADALQEFLAVSKVPATELQATYNRLNDEFKQSESNDELGQYTNATLRSQSERQLRSTRDRYAALMRVMEQASARMTPVLNAFRDQVLYLKHNLNAQAIAALDGTSRELQQDITRLIADMDRSIREADAFISNMKALPAGN